MLKTVIRDLRVERTALTPMAPRTVHTATDSIFSYTDGERERKKQQEKLKTARVLASPMTAPR